MPASRRVVLAPLPALRRRCPNGVMKAVWVLARCVASDNRYLVVLNRWVDERRKARFDPSVRLCRRDLKFLNCRAHGLEQFIHQYLRPEARNDHFDALNSSSTRVTPAAKFLRLLANAAGCIAPASRWLCTAGLKSFGRRHSRSRCRVASSTVKI